jgi:hypothetical protein
MQNRVTKGRQNITIPLTADRQLVAIIPAVVPRPRAKKTAVTSAGNGESARRARTDRQDILDAERRLADKSDLVRPFKPSR